jgi:SAM-dependent methyltransferase
MSTVKEHYDRLLSKHYSWMFGQSFEDRALEQQSFLAQALAALKQRPKNAMAVDLGSGPGFQTIALARLGFSPVIALDTSADLLNELRTHSDGLDIRTAKVDLRELPQIVSAEQASVVVCMGDTITHLEAKPDVVALLRSVFDALHPGGVFVLTYRDLTDELTGLDRFIPVCSDADTIMTCFLEYESADTVMVHDLIHSRAESGWSLAKSCYPKLRLGIDWLLQELKTAGFLIVSHGNAGRLLQVTAEKP